MQLRRVLPQSTGRDREQEEEQRKGVCVVVKSKYVYII